MDLVWQNNHFFLNKMPASVPAQNNNTQALVHAEKAKITERDT